MLSRCLVHYRRLKCGTSLCVYTSVWLSVSLAVCLSVSLFLSTSLLSLPLSTSLYLSLPLSALCRTARPCDAHMTHAHCIQSALDLCHFSMDWCCSQTKIKETFAAHDSNQNGEINMAELRALLESLGQVPSEKHLQVGRVVGSPVPYRSIHSVRSIPFGRAVRSIGSVVFYVGGRCDD